MTTEQAALPRGDDAIEAFLDWHDDAADICFMNREVARQRLLALAAVLAATPDPAGLDGIALAEAIEASMVPGARYSLTDAPMLALRIAREYTARLREDAKEPDHD